MAGVDLIVERRLSVGLTLVLLVIMAFIFAIGPSTGADELEEIRWTTADSPVILERSIEIEGTQRLVIEAGVVVQLDKDVGIQVVGELQVLGDPDLPVLFVPNTTGPVEANYWADVRLVSTSEDIEHTLSYAVFQGGDTALLVSSSRAVLDSCTFTQNRYGILVRGDGVIEATECDFMNNSVLGLEWESGATGRAASCTFLENVVGVYCYENVTPTVQGCHFEENYHHMSFAQGGNATVIACSFGPATAEMFECYWNSSPLFRGMDVTHPEDATFFLRKDSRPRFSGGTSISKIEVVSADNGSYAVNLAAITLKVVDDTGKTLEGANVTLSGDSGDVFTEGTTGADGLIKNAYMSTYTVGSPDGNDAENPHLVEVEWNGFEQTFRSTPRDLDKNRVLQLEVDTKGPEPGGWGFVPNVIVLVIIAIAAILITLWYQKRA